MTDKETIIRKYAELRDALHNVKHAVYEAVTIADMAPIEFTVWKHISTIGEDVEKIIAGVDGRIADVAISMLEDE